MAELVLFGSSDFENYAQSQGLDSIQERHIRLSICSIVVLGVMHLGSGKLNMSAVK